MAHPKDVEEREQATSEENAGENASAAGVEAAVEDWAKLKQERDELFDRAARLQAEFDNFRKRSAREQEEFRAYAVAEAVKLFLPVLDNFNLALKHKQSSAEDLRKGIELIRKQFEDALQKLGVQAVTAHGAPFDPHQHEAIEMVPSEEHPENQVIEELQRGYKLRDRLLRPAMVRVATKK